MTSTVIALYGIYLLLVGFRGNSATLLDYAKADAPGFLPWIVSLGVLAALNENDTTKPIVRPFLMLLILAFVLRNFETIRSEASKIYGQAANAAKPGVSI